MLLNRLRIYTVHLKPDEKQEIERLRFVCEGFNFYAFLFIFNLFWALQHRLWLFAAIILFGNMLIGFLTLEAAWMNPVSGSIWRLGLHVWFGYAANDFLRAKLKKQGYITYATVSGENELRAEQRFFDKHIGSLTREGVKA